MPGETRKGLIWAIPMFVFMVAVVGDRCSAARSACSALVNSAEKRLALLTLNVAFFLYHLAAMLDAYAVAQHERARSFGSAGSSGVAPIILAVLVSLAIVIHGLPEVYGVSVPQRVSRHIRTSGSPAASSRASLPTTPGPQTPTPLATPTPTPTAASRAAAVRAPDRAARQGTDSYARRRAPLAPIDWRRCPAWARTAGSTCLSSGTDSRSDEGVERRQHPDRHHAAADYRHPDLQVRDVQLPAQHVYAAAAAAETAPVTRLDADRAIPTGCASRSGQRVRRRHTTAATFRTCLDELAVAMRGAKP